MRIADMHWQQLQAQLLRDDRCVLPIGNTEQHAHLSLAVDSILAAQRARCAATATCGDYQRPDDSEVLAMWDVAVRETRALLDGPWG